MSSATITEVRKVQALRFYTKGQIQLEQVPSLYVVLKYKITLLTQTGHAAQMMYD